MKTWLHWPWRAWLGILMLSACSKSSHLGKECFSIDDCDHEQVCFLGICQSAQFGFATVYVSLTPPTASAYISQQLDDPIQLPGRQTLKMRKTATLQGSITTDEDLVHSIPGRLEAKAGGQIPTLAMKSTADVSMMSGFTLPLVADTPYRIVFTPTATNRPPYEFAGGSSGWALAGGSTTSSLHYPSPSDCVSVSGVLTSDGVTGKAGALVSGTATASNQHTLDSTTATTNSSGDFALVFPPLEPSASAFSFKISVMPGPSNLLVPKITFPSPTATASGSGYALSPLSLESPPMISPSVKVRTAGSGDLVAGATVIFTARIGDGTYTVIGLTSDQGDVQQVDPVGSPSPLQLVSGTYDVTVAPPVSQPWGLVTFRGSEFSSSSPPMALSVPHKVNISGTLRASDGGLVSSARIAFSLRTKAATRQYDVTTAGDGTYSVQVDPGTSSIPAEYEVIVDPGPSVELPRYRKLLQVYDSDVTGADIQLFPPTFAYGRVLDADGSAAAGVTVTFYSNQLAPSEPTFFLLVGLAQTNSLGEFVVPLPTPGGS